MMKYKPLKQLGQNFLFDQGVAYNMVEHLDLCDGDLVVEIGAGLGALTKVLLEKTDGVNVKVKSVEIDERFVEELQTRFSNHPNLEIINGDVLSWLPKFTYEGAFKIIGSLPYYITSPILHAIIRHKGDISKCVLLIQKEVAEKVAGKAPKASYLSTYMQTFFEVEITESVPRTYFEPQPRVDGAVIKMTKKDGWKIPPEKIEDYEDFLHSGFSKPRKMLNKVFSKGYLKSVETDEKLRPQHVSVDKWMEMYERLDRQSAQA